MATPIILSSFIFMSNGIACMIHLKKNPDKKVKIIALSSLFIGGFLLIIGCGLLA